MTYSGDNRLDEPKKGLTWPIEGCLASMSGGLARVLPPSSLHWKMKEEKRRGEEARGRSQATR